MLLLSLDFFFKNLVFQNILSGTLSISNILIQIRTDVLSVLIWVQTVCIFSRQQKSLLVRKELPIKTSCNINPKYSDSLSHIYFNPNHAKYFYLLHVSKSTSCLLQIPSCKHVFSIRVENDFDQNQMTSSGAS